MGVLVSAVAAGGWSHASAMCSCSECLRARERCRVLTRWVAGSRETQLGHCAPGVPRRRVLSKELANFLLAFLLLALTRHEGAKRMKLTPPSKKGPCTFKLRLPRVFAQLIRSSFGGMAGEHPFLAPLLDASGALSTSVTADLFKVPARYCSSHPHPRVAVATGTSDASPRPVVLSLSGRSASWCACLSRTPRTCSGHYPRFRGR